MRTQMIESHIRKLKGTFGLKRPIDDDKLQKLYQARDYLGMAGAMMTLMNIDITVNLGLVNSGGPAGPAWIRRPQPFPFLFTPQYKMVEATIYLRKSFLAEAKFESTVLALSHEFSHIVLESTDSPLKGHEEAVDLTAMLLGFRDFYVTGSVVKGKNSDYRIGYLTGEEVSHAAWFMTYGV